MSEQRRFIVSSRSIRDGYASFNGDLHHHMARVLRLRPGDELLLVDEQGRSHQGVIDQVTQEWTAVRLTSTCEAATPPVSPSITIVQGLPRGEKIDLVLQKGTELGVNGFSLFRAERSVPCLTGDKLQNRLKRWERIVFEAARQSERFDLPQLAWIPSARDAAETVKADLKLMLWERGTSVHLRETLTALPRPAGIAIAIGPEGGFAPDEFQAFSSQGFIPVTLGKRILRTETAALAMTAIVQYIWGDI